MARQRTAPAVIAYEEQMPDGTIRLRMREDRRRQNRRARRPGGRPERRGRGKMRVLASPDRGLDLHP